MVYCNSSTFLFPLAASLTIYCKGLSKEGGKGFLQVMKVQSQEERGELTWFYGLQTSECTRIPCGGASKMQVPGPTPDSMLLGGS